MWWVWHRASGLQKCGTGRTKLEQETDSADLSQHYVTTCLSRIYATAEFHLGSVVCSTRIAKHSVQTDKGRSFVGNMRGRVETPRLYCLSHVRSKVVISYI